MAKYNVVMLQNATDLLRAFVEVEAENEDEARQKAQAVYDEDPESIKFDFWKCGETEMLPANEWDVFKQEG